MFLNGLKDDYINTLFGKQHSQSHSFSTETGVMQLSAALRDEAKMGLRKPLKLRAISVDDGASLQRISGHPFHLDDSIEGAITISPSTVSPKLFSCKK